MTSGMNARKNLRAAHRVVVKIGSRALVGRRGGFDRAVFKSVAADVGTMRRAGREVALVSSGAVLAGRVRLGLMGRTLDMPLKQAAAAVGQNILMAEWAKHLSVAGLTAGQVLLTADDLGDRDRYLNSRNTMEELFRLGVVPVINENDTVAVEEIRYGDNDHLATLVAGMMAAQALLILTDIDGLYERDPACNPGQAVVPLVRETDTALLACAGPSASGVGSGGMATKVEAALTVARRGVPTVIANAKVAGAVGRIMAGEELGTLFVPEGRPLRERQYWMAFGGDPRGTVTVDDGARRAVEERGRSLLPSGVTGIEGDFKKGDLVIIATARGREIARGLANYNAPDAAKIMGRQTSEIETILGQKLYDEIIHRDYMVLTGRKEK